MREEFYMRMFESLIKRQDAIIDMLSTFMKVYAKDNNHAIEDVEEECEYINDIEGFNN
jgi:hypothetical protein